MKYVSIDLETTGIDEEFCQILQVGMVLDDLENPLPINELPKAVIYVMHDQIQGEPVGITMNYELIKAISLVKAPKKNLCLYEGAKIYEQWLRPKHLPLNIGLALEWMGIEPVGGRMPINVAGKNFAGMDRKMLDKAGWLKYVNPSARVIDPGSMFLAPDDKFVPSLSECLVRSGLDGHVLHDALDDALAVVRCVRFSILGNVHENG